jgi:2-polyprenyl-6-methoxyphenol hydroxylase-like FAD-dependent oxidoreductase
VTSGRATAVVVGGSIAGSFVARVLADHFERVIVFDRDDLPGGAVARPGAPQGVHFHALLARGRMVAAELFPGFVDDLLTGGAPTVRLRDALVYEPYGWAPTASSDRSNAGASRLLIESVIRRRAALLTNVEVRPATEVVELVASTDRRQVTGVRFRSRGNHPDSVYEQSADLVVDASGRASPVLTWLSTLGYPPPAMTRVNAHWGYSSRFCRLAEGVAPPVVGGFPIGKASDGPAATRGGFLLKQEGDLWLVTLSGCAKDFPPVDDNGFAEFARTLAFPQIGEALPHAEPLSPIRSWRNTVNRMRHFERMPSWPESFVCVGDAVCSFNPVYGQGMTVAALGSLDLAAELEAEGRDGHVGIGIGFQRRLAATIKQPWEAACRSDFGVPGVEGAPPPDGFSERFAFYERVVALGRDDPVIYEKLGATNQLVIGPDWLDEPELRARVLGAWDDLGALVGSTAGPPPEG